MWSLFSFIYLIVVVCSKENWNKSQPDDAGWIHSESDIFGFVKVWRNLPSFECVDGAQDDQDHVVNQRHDHGKCGNSAGFKSAEK